MPLNSQINIRNEKNNKHKLAIIIAWSLVNIFFLIKNGIVVTGEAEKYIGQANIFLETGKLSSQSLWLYFTQIALLSFCLKMKISFVFALIIQLFFNFIATFCFFEFLNLTFKKVPIALTGTLILLFNHPYQEFNTFLQTESLFYSFTLILSCYVLSIKKLSLKNFIGVILSLGVISITRPTGLLFIPPVFLYLFLIRFKRFSKLKKLIILLVFALIFLFIINIAMETGGEFDFILPFKDEDIICGYPSINHAASIDFAHKGNSVLGLLYYIVHNFAQFIRLSWLKTTAFFGLYRNYFSTPHNIFLIIYFYSLHILALAGLAYWIKNYFNQAVYLLLILLIIWLTVMLTCDDWHNRFYLSISPYIILLSMGALQKFFKKNK